MTNLPRSITGGVDTHLDVHVAAALDNQGALLGVESFATTESGYKKLLGWLSDFGPVVLVGVDGTGSSGAGLTRHLHAEQVRVVEVDRPNRQRRRRKGKSDPQDAISAARAALSGEDCGEAKTRDGNVESMRVFRVARSSAPKDRPRRSTRCATWSRPPPSPSAPSSGASTCSTFSSGPRPIDPGPSATSSAHQVQPADVRPPRHDPRRGDLRDRCRPEALGQRDHAGTRRRLGVGTDAASALLVTAGDNPERLRDEAAFAHLCGASPIEASSGKQERHRLNRSGDRQANSALWHIVITRMVYDPRTIEYIDRRTKEGLTKKEAVRCLKRYVAREVFSLLPHEKLGLDSP